MTLTWLDNLIIVAAHWALADIVCCLLRSIKGMPEVNLFWCRLGAGVSLIVCWAISNLDGNIAWIFPGVYLLMFLEVYLILYTYIPLFVYLLMFLEVYLICKMEI